MLIYIYIKVKIPLPFLLSQNVYVWFKSLEKYFLITTNLLWRSWIRKNYLIEKCQLKWISIHWKNNLWLWTKGCPNLPKDSYNHSLLIVRRSMNYSTYYEVANWQWRHYFLSKLNSKLVIKLSLVIFFCILYLLVFVNCCYSYFSIIP